VAGTILVEPEGDDRFQVTVRERASETVHRVTVPASYRERLTGGQGTAEELVRLSFEFLLEREPKESILPSFELSMIGRYFPEYEREVKRRLKPSPA
jgi:hypothetical protein